MKKNGKLTFKQIANKIRIRESFFVNTSAERRNVLLAATAQNISVTTRKNGLEQFQIIYL
jgi:hypothetical protein